MRLIVRLLDTVVDAWLLVIILATMAFGAYSLWDNQNIYHEADASVYKIYDPSAEEENGEDGLEKLRALNPDVVAWLRIDDTKINYPVVQGEDNNQYLNTNAVGEYSLAGSIFLDYRNEADFSSLNSIAYGHHMAQDIMFGQLDEYRERTFFDTHRTGTLYFDCAWHDITFFAFLKADAHDKVLYDPDLTECGDADGFYSYLRSHAQYFEEIELSSETRFLTLSTCCASGSPNDRYLLIGIIEEEEAEYSE